MKGGQRGPSEPETTAGSDEARGQADAPAQGNRRGGASRPQPAAPAASQRKREVPAPAGTRGGQSSTPSSGLTDSASDGNVVQLQRPKRPKRSVLSGVTKDRTVRPRKAPATVRVLQGAPMATAVKSSTDALLRKT